jgi:hypothetical protein
MSGAVITAPRPRLSRATMRVVRYSAFNEHPPLGTMALTRAPRSVLLDLSCLLAENSASSLSPPNVLGTALRDGHGTAAGRHLCDARDVQLFRCHLHKRRTTGVAQSHRQRRRHVRSAGSADGIELTDRLQMGLKQSWTRAAARGHASTPALMTALAARMCVYRRRSQGGCIK